MLVIYNRANNEHPTATGLTPQANSIVDIVVHAIWARGDEGLLEIWINGVVVLACW